MLKTGVTNKMSVLVSDRFVNFDQITVFDVISAHPIISAHPPFLADFYTVNKQKYLNF